MKLSPFPLLSLILLCIAFGCSPQRPGEEHDGDVVYLNTSSDVKFVGSKRCAACHESIAASYMQSEMGRAISLLDSANVIEHFPQTTPVYDSTKNFSYEMVRRDGRFYQREYRLDKQKEIIHERFVEANLVIGSGNNLRMYFHNENGMLYELPLTWYVHKNAWDLSPGYRDVENLRFSRFAGGKCIACHNSYLVKDPDAHDRYVQPFELGIGCERCHGPGELHVKEMLETRRESKSPGPRTIVNPRKLSHQRQMDICRQCHLQGKAWALQDGKDWFDFRPGQLLESHRSVYVSSATTKEAFEVADSPQRLVLSACFKRSDQTLTCITCHDPHRSIKTFSREHYNGKCRACHSQATLTRSPLRHQHAAGDDCISCHMNRTGNDNTLHGVSNTDHWIRREASKTVIDWTRLRRPAPMRPVIDLVPEVDAKDGGERVRRGSAYLEYYQNWDMRGAYLDSSLQNLIEGIKQKSSTGAFLDLGRAHLSRRRDAEAIAAFETALQNQPDLSEAYFGKGEAYFRSKNPALAVENFQQALRWKKNEPRYLESLAAALIETGDMPGAAHALERSLVIDSQSPVPFALLAQLNALQLGNTERALDLYQKALTIDPDIEGGYSNLGNVHVLRGEYDKAELLYKRELARSPGSPSVLLNLGRAYMLAGRKKEALAVLERAAKADPSSGSAREYIEQLRKR